MFFYNFKIYLFLIIWTILLCYVDAISDPYETLGVSRSAPIPEIKQAYKKLAKKWHPDKNKDPEAENKFIDVNKAYEILVDPERKDLFDRTGQTEDTPNFRQKADYSQYRRYEFDPFESLFSQGSSRFQFNQGTVYHKITITKKGYDNNIMPNSASKPYLIVFYGDLCFPCLHAEPVLQKIIQELEPLGMGFAAIHAQHENALARKIGVNSLPYLVGIIDSQVVHFKENTLSLVKVVEFARKLFPYRTILSANDDSVDDFLGGWSDNRVRVLFFSPSDTVKLRFLLVAYKFRMRAAFAYVRINQADSRGILQRYSVNPSMDSLLIFNENSTVPIATLSMRELAPQTMADVLEANRFLLLPRLSSQLMFDQLCPPDSGRRRKHLCVVLITQNTQAHDPYRAAMRDFIRQADFLRDRIRFMFLYQEKQEEFVRALSSGEGAPQDPVLHVVVLWRKDMDRVRYQWLDSPWTISKEQVNSSKQELEDTLNYLVQTTEALPYDAKVSTLTDEYAHGLLRRLVNRFMLMGSVLRENISRQELLPAVSVILSVGFIILVGYLMSYLVQLEEQHIQEKYRREGKEPPNIGKPKQDCKLNVHELRGETYNGLVRLLKPGCRTVVLLLDSESRTKLLPKFYRCVYPYRKNKTLMFAFLMVEKNLEWYRRLLQQTLGEDRELNINPKNCIGTVLSLNGHRKYYCVYHAKHAEHRQAGVNPKQQQCVKNQSKPVSSGGVGGGSTSSMEGFIGFEESTESECSDVEAGQLIQENDDYLDSFSSNVLFEEHLLDGLSNWLDRLFEGSTKRYYIQYWPENMK